MSSSQDSDMQRDSSDKFQSADDMVRSVVNSDGEVRVAACSVAVEEKTRLIVHVAIAIVALIIILAIGFDPYYILIPIVVVEFAFMVYLGVMGGNDAIILHRNDDTSNWSRLYVVKGVSLDQDTQSFSYKSAEQMRSRRERLTWSLPRYPWSIRQLGASANLTFLPKALPNGLVE